MPNVIAIGPSQYAVKTYLRNVCWLHMRSHMSSWAYNPLHGPMYTTYDTHSKHLAAYEASHTGNQMKPDNLPDGPSFKEGP